MPAGTQIRKEKPSLFNRLCLIWIILALGAWPAASQCFSSANPVGGSSNLLVLDKKSFRFVGFYRHAYSNRYFEKSSKSDFNQVNDANYNYGGAILAFGFFQKLTLETEWGYFFNKTYHFNVPAGTDLSGCGFYNTVVSGKFRIFTDYARRFYISGSVGAKIPLMLEPKVKNGITLPVDLQPSSNAFGSVLQLFFVKENSESGMRYFLISRYEYNLPNRNDYRLGYAFLTSFFVSKHLPDHWLPGDWTAIIQLRNESRAPNRREGMTEVATGGTIFLLSPQVNYNILEKWNVSLILDIPVYQYLNGIQLAYNYAITVNLSRDINFY
jgi:hypothetical protein